MQAQYSPISRPPREDVLFILDLSNVTRSKYGHGDTAYISRFERMYTALIKKLSLTKKNIVAIADASIRYHIDNKKRLADYIRRKMIILTPAGTDADAFILQLAKNHGNARVISNDQFRDYEDEYDRKWLRTVRITFLFIDHPYRDTLFRSGGKKPHKY